MTATKQQAYRLSEDVYSQTLNARGHAVEEGWLPAGTVVEPCGISPDTSPLTQTQRGNRSAGIVVRIIRTADGGSGRGLAREVLQGVGRLEDVAEAVAQLEWEQADAGQDAMTETTGRVLFVGDGQVGHFVTLPDDATALDALTDYAAGYDCPPQEITVRWHLYEDGQEKDAGRYAFRAR